MTTPKTRFPRSLREAFQSKNNPPLSQRESRFHGEFIGARRARFWRTLKSLILGT